MKSTSIFWDSMTVSLGIGPDIKDVTSELNQIVARSMIGNGILYATVIGSTGSITTIEFEPGVIVDLKAAINRMAPPGIDYAHEQAWHDGNGHSHVQAAILGPSIAVSIRNQRMRLGTWQQVVVINHDNRARSRPLEITITGTIE